MTRANLEKRPGEVSAMFDKVADRYDLLNDALSLGLDRRWRRVVAKAVGAGPGQLVLDLAAGTGTSARAFTAAGAHCVACDFSLGMLSVGARRKAERLGFVAGDALALPFADGTFDAVTGFNSFQYAASPVNALCEARRVVKKGGVIIVAVWGLPEGCDAAGHLKALGSLMPSPPPGAPGPFTLSDEAKLKALAGEAGLTPSAVIDVPCPWVYADLETALRGMLSAGPAERAIRASSFERAREAVAASIGPYRTASGGYRLNNTFRYLVARS